MTSSSEGEFVDFIREIRPSFFLLPRDVVFTGETLGKGSAGYVIKVKYREIWCAAKPFVIDRQFDTLNNDLLRRELTVLCELNHKNVVQLVGICVIPTEGAENPHSCWILTTKAECSLLSSLERLSESPLAARLALLRCIISGVLYLHNLQVGHLDLKPANILLDEVDNPRIADFGLSRCTLSGNTLQSVLPGAGTLFYMPPEQLSGEKVTLAADIYAFALMALQILTGVHPMQARFGDDQAAAVAFLESGHHLEVPSLQPLSRGESPSGMFESSDYDELRELFHQCLSPQPKGRPKAQYIFDTLDRMLGWNTLPEAERNTRMLTWLRLQKRSLETMMRYSCPVIPILTRYRFTTTDFDVCGLAEALMFGTQGVTRNTAQALSLFSQLAAESHPRALFYCGLFNFLCCFRDFTNHTLGRSQLLHAQGLKDRFAQLFCMTEDFGGKLDIQVWTALRSRVEEEDAHDIEIYLLGRLKFPESNRMLDLSCARGNVLAMHDLACRLRFGQGCVADVVRAFHLSVRARDGGHLGALFQLSHAHELGHGVTQDQTLALAGYREAAEAGYPAAMCQLGLFYQYGRGNLEVNFEEAWMWFERAIAGGYHSAEAKLRLLRAMLESGPL